MSVPALDQLLLQLSSESTRERIDAARSLGELSPVPDPALRVLATALGDAGEIMTSPPDYTPWSGGGMYSAELDRVSSSAEKALERAGHRAIAPLLAVIADPSCRRAAERLLSKLGWAELARHDGASLATAVAEMLALPGTSSELGCAIENFTWVIERGDADALTRLREHPSDAARQNAIGDLDGGDPDVVAALVQAVLEPRWFPQARASAIAALGALESCDAEALQPIAAQLSASHLRAVWPEAITLLGRHRVREALPALSGFALGKWLPRRMKPADARRLALVATKAIEMIGGADE